MTEFTFECEACGHRSHTGTECVAGIFTVCGCDADYPREVHDREVDEFVARREPEWLRRRREGSLPAKDLTGGI